MPRLKPKRRTAPPYETERHPAPESPTPLQRPGQILRNLSLLTMGGGIALACLLGIGLLRAGESFITDAKSLFNSPQPEPEVDVRSIVVQQVRDISELSTAVFNMEAVVPSRRDRTLGNLTVGSTTLLYIAYGEVRAGIDLSQLQPSDVTRSVTPQGDQLTITLPPAQILDQKIDINRSSVYDYDRGFLNLGPDSAIELQSVASQAALNKIVTAACQQGILDQASDTARLVVSQLMATAGQSTGQSVIVETTPATGCGPASAPVANRQSDSSTNAGVSNTGPTNSTPTSSGNAIDFNQAPAFSPQ